MKQLILLLTLGIGISVSLEAQTTPGTNTDVGKPPQKFTPKVTNPYGLTQAELQELSQARQEALKADPDLAKAQAELVQKMRNFEREVDQAVLRDNPDLAPIVAQQEGGRGARFPLPPRGIGSVPTTSPPPNH